MASRELLQSFSVTFRFYHGTNSTKYTDIASDLSVSYEDLIRAFNQLICTGADGFIYRDSDGDIITVRSQEEIPAFLCSVVLHLEVNASSVPFTIYPKCRENIHNLIVDTSTATSHTNSNDNGLFRSKPSLVFSKTTKRPTSSEFESAIQDKSISLNDIQFLDLISSGNGREIYKCVHIPTQRKMAIKQITLDITSEEQQQIISELGVLWLCESPYIIKFYGSIPHGNIFMICTEYMDGRSLDNCPAVPENVLGKIAHCIIEGQKYLWSIKILHRDIKPSNILVNSLGEIKLCDFGVSIQLIKSMARTFIGTNAYMAPERIKGEDYSVAAEIWSIGITIMELATAKFPYSTSSPSNVAISPIELIHCILNESPPQLKPNKFSPDIIEFVHKILNKDPILRPSLDQLLQFKFILVNKELSQIIIAEWVKLFLKLK